MTRTLHPYPSYRPSAVPWLGDVPDHWKVGKLREILAGTSDRNRPDLPLLSVVRERGVILRDITNIEENHNYIPDDLSNYKVVHRGQLAMNKMKAWQGSYGVSMYDGIVSPAYFVFAIDGVAGDYLHTAIRSKSFISFFAQASDGVRIGQWDLSQARMREIPFLVPPLPEQRTIVQYLNHVDRRSRRYVSAKQRLIALLEEEKQAVINQAVTRGLDPNARLKPSGVEWLGDVPEHWEVTKLARVVRSSNAGEVIDKGWWGRGTEVLYTCARQPVQSEYASFPSAKRTTGLDLLLTRNGTPYVHRPVSSAIYSNVVQRITLAAGTDREWIALTLEASAREMKGYGVSIESLNYDMWKVLVVLVPPKDEQTAIVGYLDKATAGIAAVAARARRQIELVEEYRTRLIADVVTGKLDVREAAARLPDEADGAAEDVAGELARADAV